MQGRDKINRRKVSKQTRQVNRRGKTRAHDGQDERPQDRKKKET